MKNFRFWAPIFWALAFISIVTSTLAGAVACFAFTIVATVVARLLPWKLKLVNIVLLVSVGAVVIYYDVQSDICHAAHPQDAGYYCSLVGFPIELAIWPVLIGLFAFNLTTVISVSKRRKIEKKENASALADVQA